MTSPTKSSSGGSSIGSPTGSSDTLDTFGLNPLVVRWLIALKTSVAENLYGLIDETGQAKLLKYLVLFLILDKNKTKARKTAEAQSPAGTPLSGSSSPPQSIGSPSRLGRLSPFSLHNQASPALSARSLDPSDEWCPVRSRVVSIGELAARKSNYASVDTSMAVPEDTEMFRMLIGQITSGNGTLMLRDATSSVPIVLAGAPGTDGVHLFDATVLVSSWRLVAPSNNVAPYIEIERMRVLYRDANHPYQRAMTSYLKTNDKMLTFTTHLARLFAPIQPVSAVVQAPRGARPVPINIAAHVVAKSVVLSSTSDSLFFTAQLIGADQSTCFAMFKGAQTKWHDLLDIGVAYLFAGADIHTIFRGTPSERTLILIGKSTKILGIDKPQDIGLPSTPPRSPPISVADFHITPLRLDATVDYVGVITSDFDTVECTYGLDHTIRLFPSHFNYNGFYGAGFRIGTEILLQNVHPIYVNNVLQGLAMCSNSSFKFLSFVKNQRLRNFTPFQESPYAMLSLKYTVIDSFILPKLFERLMIKFPYNFVNFQSFTTPYKSQFLFDQIARSFAINRVAKFQSAADRYDIFFNHDHNCGSMHYVQFSIKDCDMVAPTNAGGVLNLQNHFIEFTRQTASRLVTSARTHSSHIFFRLIGKIIQYGELSITGYLLFPGLPLIKVVNVAVWAKTQERLKSQLEDRIDMKLLTDWKVEWKSYDLLVKKSDTNGNILQCVQLEDIDSRSDTYNRLNMNLRFYP
eukprot:gene11533-13460_t